MTHTQNAIKKKKLSIKVKGFLSPLRILVKPFTFYFPMLTNDEIIFLGT